jgi:hypothetical protein
MNDYFAHVVIFRELMACDSQSLAFEEFLIFLYSRGGRSRFYFVAGEAAVRCTS